MVQPMKAHLIYFSPTRGTKKVCEAFARGTGWETIVTDVTRPAMRRNAPPIGEDEVAVFGFPVYGGHAPKMYLDLIERVKGNGGKAVLIAVYGNRAFDMALADAFAAVAPNGFEVAACAAFIGEHSFTEEIQPGRPDAEDLRTAEEYGRRAARLIEAGESRVFTAEEIPQKPVDMAMIGMHGQRLRAIIPNRPEVDLGRCIHCGTCARACPMGLIDPEDSSNIREGCIKCRACAKRCPVKAIEITHPNYAVVAADALEQFGREPKSPELWV